MRIPRPTPLRTYREVVTEFGGYDHRLVISPGSWYDEENVSTEKYPVASVRRKFGSIPTSGEGPITGIFEANGRIGYTKYVSSGTPAADHGAVYFYKPGASSITTADLGLNGERKKFVRFGAYVIILPDKKYINTADETDRGSLADASYEMWSEQSADPPETGSGTLTVMPVYEDGSAMTYTASDTEPADPDDGALWYSTSGKMLYRYYAGSGWREYPEDTFIKLAWNDVTQSSGFGFEDGLYIRIVAEYFNWSTVSGNVGRSLTSGYYPLVKSGLDSGHRYIILKYDFAAGSMTDYDIYLSWGLPDMDYLIESGNRLWGCKYGRAQVITDDGDLDWANVNMIYASELGNFKEFFCYDGTDAASYYAAVGTDGAFTGAVSYQGRPVFFKEKMMHRVYGSVPTQYQVENTECHGIKAGCSRSAAIVDGVLYYNSPEGFAAFDGSLPVIIDAALGGCKYGQVSAAGYDRRYFCHAFDKSGAGVILIYDARLGTWEKYPAPAGNDPVLFAEAEDDMCFISAADSFGDVHTWNGSGEGAQEATPVEWYAESGDLGLGDLTAKYVILCSIRMRLAVGTVVRVKIKYDDGEWRQISARTALRLETFALPVPVRRCDHFRLRIEGVGDAAIYGIERLIQGGGRQEIK